VQNARIVGRIVVAQGQRQVVERIGKLLHRAADGDGSDAPTSADGADGTADATATPSAPAPTPKPTADPADTLIVEGALAGYDTLSASQVVRRLESLGPDELRALNRHEASHRNRHTILNRAHQILEAIEAADDADPSHPVASASDAPATAVTETGAPEDPSSDFDAPAVATPEGTTPDPVAPEAVIPATPPPAATAPEPDLPHE
jgi:hypothetical protein